MSVYLGAKIKFFLQFSKFRAINSFYLQKNQVDALFFLLFFGDYKDFIYFCTDIINP